MSITVSINGQGHTFAEAVTVADLVRRYAKGGGVAVAVNETFVPRERHDEFAVKEGDRVELLTPMEGG